MPFDLQPLPVDMLLGMTSGEVPPPPLHGSAPEYFGRFLGNDTVQHIISLYQKPPSDHDIVRDVCGQCQEIFLAHRFAARSGSMVHYYVYDYPHNAAPHSAEIQTVF